MDGTTERCLKLRELWRTHNLSLADVAELLGVSLDHAKHLRAGTKPVSRRILRLLQLELETRGKPTV